MAMPAEYLESAARQWRRFADGMRDRFQSLCKEHCAEIGEVESSGDLPTVAWREAEGREAQAVAERARLFDLVVLGRTTRPLQDRWTATCEALLFESGRPVLIVPPKCEGVLGGTAVIAWNGSMENARTVALSLLLLASARRVVVLSVAEGMLPGPSGQDLATHLARHGLEVTARTVKAGGRTVGEATLEEARATGASLLVKGAYARGRLRQMIFGGATSHVIEHADLPVVMAH
jgi:nucleotide-binding universal stress UspA family protein